MKSGRRAAKNAYTCERKVAYGQHESSQIAERMHDEGKDVEAYRCNSCGLWHIGSYK